MEKKKIEKKSKKIKKKKHAEIKNAREINKFNGSNKRIFQHSIATTKLS